MKFIFIFSIFLSYTLSKEISFTNAYYFYSSIGCNYDLSFNSVYPNPAPRGPWIKGDIELNGGVYDFNVEVYNALSQLVFSRFAGTYGSNPGENKLKIPDLNLWKGLDNIGNPVPNGSYTVKLKANLLGSNCVESKTKKCYYFWRG